MMKKAIRRVLDQLRGATTGVFGNRAATRDGLREPQHLEALPVPARGRQ